MLGAEQDKVPSLWGRVRVSWGRVRVRVRDRVRVRVRDRVRVS